MQDNYHDAQDVSAVWVVRMNLIDKRFALWGFGRFGKALCGTGGLFLVNHNQFAVRFTFFDGVATTSEVFHERFLGCFSKA